MSQTYNTIEIPAEEGSQLPISDSLTSPDSGVTASSKAAYDLNIMASKAVTIAQKGETSGQVGSVVRVNGTGTKIDDYKTSGNYWFTSGQTPEGWPLGVNGRLQVFAQDTLEQVQQYVYRYGTVGTNDHQIAYRTYQVTTKTWGAWYRLDNEAYSNVDNTADINKNVASAAKLTSIRKIGGVEFDGTKDIDLPGVNKEGNQNTTGSAAKLTTARTIGGVTFDGTKNIDLPGVNTKGTQDTSGRADSAISATYWLHARKLTLSGKAAGSVMIQGDQDVTLNVTALSAVDTVATNTSTSSSTGSGKLSSSSTAQSLVVSANTIRFNYHTTINYYNCDCDCNCGGDCGE